MFSTIQGRAVPYLLPCAVVLAKALRSVHHLLYGAVHGSHLDGGIGLATCVEPDAGAAAGEGAALCIQPAAAPGVQHIYIAAPRPLRAAAEEDKAAINVGVDWALLSPLLPSHGCCSRTCPCGRLALRASTSLLVACGFSWHSASTSSAQVGIERQGICTLEHAGARQALVNCGMVSFWWPLEAAPACPQWTMLTRTARRTMHRRRQSMQA